MLSMDEINRVEAVSKEISSQWITNKSLRDKTYQTFKAKDLESWLCGAKLKNYKYFTYRCNNPYLRFSSKNHITLMQDKVYLTEYLPDYDEVGKEYYDGIDEDDVITVYYSNNWWEKCIGWNAVKAKLKRDGNKQN